MITPAPGTIVRYVLRDHDSDNAIQASAAGAIRPAIVIVATKDAGTSVPVDADSDQLELHILTAGTFDHGNKAEENRGGIWRTSVKYDANKSPGTWHA